MSHLLLFRGIGHLDEAEQADCQQERQRHFALVPSHPTYPRMHIHTYACTCTPHVRKCQALARSFEGCECTCGRWIAATLGAIMQCQQLLHMIPTEMHDTQSTACDLASYYATMTFAPMESIEALSTTLEGLKEGKAGDSKAAHELSQ